jgi:uncharacterized protein (DUF305 family)
MIDERPERPSGRVVAMIRRLPTVVAVLSVALAGGCTADRPTRPAGPAGAAPSASATAAPVRVIVPGRPGESGTVTDSDTVRAPDGSAYNTLDTTFVQMMIPHHEQALAMAGLAAGRAGDPQVSAVAARITAAQRPEITRLRAWLTERGLGATGSGHDHGAMPGMQDEAAMTALSAARGADFDRRFVTMMTAHHRGALQMAGDVLAGGSDQSIAELANELAVEQGSEIRRLADLGVG